jgi:hypothetical protein
MIRRTGIRHGILGGGLAVLTGVCAAIIHGAPAGSRGGEAGASGSVPAASPAGTPAQNDLVVHEWGTFLAMSGSDGTSLDGMYHEEHALPGFVHARSRDQLRLPSIDVKGETPVIYFYTNHRQNVRVGVGFPLGVWTQWYPQAAALNPTLESIARHPETPRDGRICWRAELIPAAAVKQAIAGKPGAKVRPEVELPAAGHDHLWNFARDVDAAFVKTNDITTAPPRPEFERFLFYRGLGQARLPLRLDAGSGGTVTLDRDPSVAAGVRHVFVLRIEKGRGAFHYLPALLPGESASEVIPSMRRSQPMAEFTRAVSDALAQKLTESGLFPKEARAMVNTWRNSYFESDGVRALFVLPQSWTDAFIPITIVPQPKQIVRVMVGRQELLSHEREVLAENAVRSLSSADPSRREQAFAFLREQGRYVEPIVRRVLRTTNDEGVRTLCRRLILSDFVTELRTTVNRASDGARQQGDPILLRAYLARLLREIGLADEARQHGTTLLALLKKISPPPGQTPNSNADLLAVRAAAFEAMGEDKKAAATYARSIELRSRNITSFEPYQVFELRDWWAGRGYAQSIARCGKSESTIAALTSALSAGSPSPVACCNQNIYGRMLLGYLLDGCADSSAAEQTWSSLAGKLSPEESPVTVGAGDKLAKPFGS